MNDDTVLVSGFLANGKLAYEQRFSTYEWYEETHSLIDTDEARRFYKIARILVRQHDIALGQEILGETNYDAEGKIVDAWKHINGKREAVAIPGR